MRRLRDPSPEIDFGWEEPGAVCEDVALVISKLDFFGRIEDGWLL